ncbi:cytochrome c oxidase subunit 5A, mitochondrial [Lutzomyia longipalpis]|uniref:cytochrome c oxidase subunit 5A, mitochondrial n=1 Tax=Lutzomyia longipalpis TaxID=7200 RepID=UPI00248445FE|nr:cytochrome c oxidase subunit 5A, mitochondrial [Lutzomyia longipalpis]
MFRSAATQLVKVARGSMGLTVPRLGAVAAVRQSHGGPVETDEEFDARYEAYFSRPDIDGWQLRKGMNDILGMDLVPEPKIIIAGLKACRRVNDFALAIRWLEGVIDKCGPKKPEIYPYLLSEIRPTLDELGINTPEELGYNTPELALKSVWED